MRSRKEVKRILEAALRKHFPHDTVDVSDGYRDNIHVMVVSRKFDQMRERIRDDCLWTIVQESGLTREEIGLVSLLLALSPGEIK